MSDADISDRSNTSAAFQFLAEIERNKQSTTEANGDDDDFTSDKIVFSKRKKPLFNQSTSVRKAVETRSTDNDEEKSVMKGSKLVMPEYVIGAKLKTKEKKRSHSSSSEKSGKEKGSKKKVLQLRHLMEDEDEDFDVDKME